MRLPLAVLSLFAATDAAAMAPYASHVAEGRSVIVTTARGEHLRLTAYGDRVVRVQAASPGEAFTPDDRHAMVATHEWPGALAVKDEGASLRVSLPKVELLVSKDPLRIAYVTEGKTALAQEGIDLGDRPMR